MEDPMPSDWKKNTEELRKVTRGLFRILENETGFLVKQIKENFSHESKNKGKRKNSSNKDDFEVSDRNDSGVQSKDWSTNESTTGASASDPFQSSSNESTKQEEVNGDEERLRQYVAWAKDYVEKLKNKNSEEFRNIKESTINLLLTLGVSDHFISETFNKNKVEIFEHTFGEIISVFALVFSWKERDKEMFSQAIGQIGVAGLAASSPITCLIAMAGLAMGYNKMFHAESMKKGGVLSLVGLGVATVVPGGIVVSFLAALSAVVVVNSKLNIEEPVEEQIKRAAQKVSESLKKNGGLNFTK